VAGGPADLVHLKEDGIGIAIEEDAAHLLHVAALLALAPELVAATAEVDHAAGPHRLFPGLAVHPRQHQHLAGRGILSDGGEQPAGLLEIGTE
jgi:hypothetical protein